MLVKFQTKAYADITMFSDVAVRLLRLMGHSGTIPSAILAEDVPRSLAQLRQAVAADRHAAPTAATRGDDTEDEEPRPVSLRQRAFPLIELLEAAARNGTDVMWSEVRG